MKRFKDPARMFARTVKILLVIHTALLFAGLSAYLWIIDYTTSYPTCSTAYGPFCHGFPFICNLCPVIILFRHSILFLPWTYWSYQNLIFLGNRDLLYSPGWAVGWHFIPIMNLFRPCQVMKEIWKGSDPEADLSRPDAWKDRPVSPLLKGWWGLWIPGNLLIVALFLSPHIPLSFPPISTVGDLFLYSSLIEIVNIALCLVTFLLVRASDQRPEKRFLQNDKKARASL